MLLFLVIIKTRKSRSNENSRFIFIKGLNNAFHLSFISISVCFNFCANPMINVSNNLLITSKDLEVLELNV